MSLADSPNDGSRPHPGDGGPQVPGIGAAAALLLCLAALFLLGGPPLYLFLGEFGLLLAQLGLLFLPVAVYLWRGGFDLAVTLSLRLPSRSQLLGGIVLLAGGLQLALVLAWLQGRVVPVPTEYLEALSSALTPDSLPRYAWLLVLAAVAPAVVEETLFRGVVLAALRRRLPAAGAVVVAGLIFGLFHLTPETAFRFLPTAWLGMVLGWVVVASGSLPLSVLLHFLNNAIVLTLTAWSVGDPASSALEEGPPFATMVVGPVLFLWGLSILKRSGARGVVPGGVAPE